MRYFIGDTETTGLKQARACEIALIEIDPDTLQILKTWEALLDPEKEIEPTALVIHGISNESVADEPTMSEWIEQRMDGGRIDDEVTLIGHNVQFDKPMLAEPLTNIVQTFCTLAFVRRQYPSMTNHRLGTVAEFFKLDAGEAHRAMSDCMVVYQILCKVLPESGKTLREHLKVTAHTIYVMPWGEHKGKPLHEVPRDYRIWVMGRPNLDPDLKRSLVELHKAGL